MESFLQSVGPCVPEFRKPDGNVDFEAGIFLNVPPKPDAGREEMTENKKTRIGAGFFRIKLQT